jgi:hypothetical protein
MKEAGGVLKDVNSGPSGFYPIHCQRLRLPIFEERYIHSTQVLELDHTQKARVCSLSEPQ